MDTRRHVSRKQNVGVDWLIAAHGPASAGQLKEVYMISKLARVTMISAAVFAVALLANAQSKDPFVGTWRLNVAKSNSPGPVPKSITTTYEAAGQGYKVW